ncbi:Uroporphyrinogen III synthase HEM4 [Janibacter hoylei PVAS-1]|uniref:Uroporphyrinogen III synthase HEM4 n=1 Tax=Janibacter hoylei PVAS-1 TaxID=1210046 RepID=K1E5Q1_9MICO|nr:Uroporphyrinogen III synthase HEM4 [Janibacter hoylei PVAS-1]
MAGRTVLITADRRSDDLAEAFARRGATIRHAAAMSIVHHSDDERLVADTRALVADPPDLVVVTTGAGLRGWLEAADVAGLHGSLTDALSYARIFARGPKAKGALVAHGLTPRVGGRVRDDRRDHRSPPRPGCRRRERRGPAPRQRVRRARRGPDGRGRAGLAAGRLPVGSGAGPCRGHRLDPCRCCRRGRRGRLHLRTGRRGLVRGGRRRGRHRRDRPSVTRRSARRRGRSGHRCPAAGEGGRPARPRAQPHGCPRARRPRALRRRLGLSGPRGPFRPRR